MKQSSVSTPISANRSPAKQRLRDSMSSLGMLPVLLIVSIVLFQFENSRFLAGDNVLNILQQSVYLILISIGQMLVLVSGGFDLSVGATVALTSVVSSTVMVKLGVVMPDSPIIAAYAGFGSAIGVGLVVGLVNGIGVSFMRVNPFIVTLATSSVIQGLTLLISQGSEIGPLPDSFVSFVGSGMAGGIPIAALLALPAIGVVYLLVDWAKYGRNLFAIGSNPKAAFVSGVNVNLSLTGTYVLCSLLTAISSFMLTARVSSGQPLLGAEFPLSSITAAVIGGCSLKGGQGGLVGTILGALFVTMLSNGMDLVRLGSNYQMIILGVVLVVAVLLDRNRR